MFLNGESLQFASLLPVAGEWLLLIKKAWQKRDENLEQSITRLLQDYFLLFLHSHVKPTLQATIKFVEANDTNCI